ncbi:MAG TPA: FtsW/RodA/SpoVE family cell cycle protein [Egibacteraceae bacterium]|nr:FtsW/RodA/SpoVE family cell cycle protein [Egibacteraceae bacterium]
MNVSAPRVAAAATPADTRRRSNIELGLLVLAILTILCAYALIGLARTATLPPGMAAYGGALAALAVAAHLVSRRLAPGADPLPLPLAFLLNGLGLVMVNRIDYALIARGQESSLAPAQTVWTVVAVGAFCATLVAVPDHRDLDRYRYLIGVGALALLALPSVPGIGATINGAQLWIRVAGFTIQPGELAKLGLVAFFASYLADKQQLLSAATSRLGPLMVPPARAFGPVIAIWGVSLALLVLQKDLGLSLLVFGLFVLMLYVATGRPAYVAGGAVLFGVGAWFAYSAFSHVRLRVAIWLDPWADYQDEGFQLAQSLFALGTGGLAGVGLGQGRPDFIPAVATDFIFSAFGEEAGLLGTTGLLLCYFLLVGRGLTISMRCRDGFGTLLAAGLTILFGLQVFIIVAGVTRLLPLTGLTLPLVSYGGSSLLANYVLVALLLRVSAAKRPPGATP